MSMYKNVSVDLSMFFFSFIKKKNNQHFKPQNKKENSAAVLPYCKAIKGLKIFNPKIT